MTVPIQGAWRARAVGRLLVVERNARLPDICLKCGAVAGLTRRRQQLQRTPSWVSLAFAPTALLAFQDTGFSMLAAWGPVLGMIVMLVGTKKAKLDLALCARCKRRWTAAILAMAAAATAPLIAVMAFTLSIVRSFGARAPLTMSTGVGAVALSVLVPVVVYFLYVGPRLLGVKGIDAKTITLARVHPDAAALILRDAATP
jgi:hypothetical protein